MKSPFLTKTTWQIPLEHNCEIIKKKIIDSWQERKLKFNCSHMSPFVTLPIPSLDTGSSSRQLKQVQPLTPLLEYSGYFLAFLHIQSTLTHPLILVVKAWVMKISVFDSYCCCKKLPLYCSWSNTKLFSWRSEVQNVFYTAKIKVLIVLLPLQGLGDNQVPCLFHILEAALLPWLLTPFSTTKPSIHCLQISLFPSSFNSGPPVSLL